MLQQKSLHQVYNSGKIKIMKKERGVDEFNTPLSHYDYKLIREAWYRNLSVYANEHFSSLQMDTVISKKIAIRLFEVISNDVISSYSIFIGGKEYSITRVFHSYDKMESELSLEEVVYE